jgi:hypothetical protein
MEGRNQALILLERLPDFALHSMPASKNRWVLPLDRKEIKATNLFPPFYEPQTNPNPLRHLGKEHTCTCDWICKIGQSGCDMMPGGN